MTTETLIGHWQQRMRDAQATNTLLCIRGGGTKDFYGERSGHQSAGELFEVSANAGIVDYDPTELVITAKGGTRLAEIESAMEESAQMLAFEPPHFGEAATLGGCVATGLSGPRRPYAGAVRDFVLGVRVLDGKGDDLSFGGRVMKNVAGFDVSRLMTGALGTLGILLEVSLKCLPRPKAESTLTFDLSGADAVVKINAWSGQPLPISASSWHEGQLSVRLSGAESAVRAATSKLGGETIDAASAAAFWRALREQRMPFFESASQLWRLSVKPTAPFAELDAFQLMEWGGALRWLNASSDLDAAKLRQWATANGGHATLFRTAGARDGVFQPLAPPLLAIHKRLKSTFDPAGILNRGRMYPDF
jgi:glycolate oxidase FAD binding subunit